LGKMTKTLSMKPLFLFVCLLLCFSLSNADDDDHDLLAHTGLRGDTKTMKELMEEIQVVLANSPTEEIACADVCGILKTNDTVEGTPTKNYVPFCERQCPTLLPVIIALGAQHDVKILRNLIIGRLHDEL